MSSGKTVTALLAILVLAGPVLGTTAKQYRGPADEVPQGILPPGVERPLGLARLVSRSGQIEGETRWEFWWEVNRDRFLRRALAARGVETANGPMAAFVGAPPPRDRLTPADVKTQIVPALLERLASPDPEERAVAALALGKARATQAFVPLRTLLERGTRADRRAAALALGFLGEPLAMPVLAEFMGRGGLSPGDRAYAALGLGFLGAEEAAPALRRALLESIRYRGRQIEEFQAAAATALGLLEDGASLPLLLRLAGGRRGRAEEVRAAAVSAAGRIGDPAALAALLAALKDNQVEVRRAAAQALGALGVAPAKPALAEAFEKDGDVQVRNLAAVALAEIGGRDVGDLLVRGLDLKNPRAVRGFSALALGILKDRSRAPRLRELLGLSSESSLVGAAAVGLALLGDTVSMAPLWRIASDPARDDDLRGYAVLSLAMLGDSVTRSRLLAFARERSGADLRRSATLAVGLFDDLPAGPGLLASLFEEGDPWVRGAASSALALDPRRSVLDTLLAVARTPGFSADERKDALVALGNLALLGRPSPVEALLSHLNYRSMIGAVRDAAYLL